MGSANVLDGLVYLLVEESSLVGADVGEGDDDVGSLLPLVCVLEGAEVEVGVGCVSVGVWVGVSVGVLVGDASVDVSVGVSVGVVVSVGSLVGVSVGGVVVISVDDSGGGVVDDVSEVESPVEVGGSEVVVSFPEVPCLTANCTIAVGTSGRPARASTPFLSAPGARSRMSWCTDSDETDPSKREKVDSSPGTLSAFSTALNPSRHDLGRR